MKLRTTFRALFGAIIFSTLLVASIEASDGVNLESRKTHLTKYHDAVAPAGSANDEENATELFPSARDSASFAHSRSETMNERRQPRTISRKKHSSRRKVKKPMSPRIKAAASAIQKKTTTSSRKKTTTSINKSSTRRSSTTSKRTTSYSSKKSTSMSSKRSTSTSTRKLTTSTRTSTSSSPTTSSPTVATTQFETVALQLHNTYRSKHSTPALTWDATLAKSAKEWAVKCQWEHTPNNPYGQNLAVGTASDFGATDSVDAWYEEIKYYDYANPGFSEKTGHFTQVVWKSSSRVGCALAVCPASFAFSGATGNANYVVCDYSPPGNYLGEFRQNVLPLRTA